MANDPPPMIELEMIIATSHPLEAYDGVQFGVEALEQLAEGLRSGGIPMLNNHDPLRPMQSRVLDVGVRETDDGFHEVWLQAEVSADDWEAFDRERKELGAPGGMSFSCSEHLEVISDSGELGIGTMTIAADAACWNDEILRAAGTDLAVLGTVDVQRRYSFAQDPTPFVVYGLPVLQGLLSSAIYDSAKHFLVPHRQSVFQFDFNEGDRSVQAVVKTSDTDVLHHAIGSFDRLVDRDGTTEWKDQDGDWSHDEPPESG